MSYLPDVREQGKLVPRKYLVTVLFAKRPEYMRHVVNHAIDLRQSSRAFNDEHGPIQVAPAVLEMLTDRVFASRKFFFLMLTVFLI